MTRGVMNGELRFSGGGKGKGKDVPSFFCSVASGDTSERGRHADERGPASASITRHSGSSSFGGKRWEPQKPTETPGRGLGCFRCGRNRRRGRWNVAKCLLVGSCFWRWRGSGVLWLWTLQFRTQNSSGAPIDGYSSSRRCRTNQPGGADRAD